jgi:hypothetical protein
LRARMEKIGIREEALHNGPQPGPSYALRSMQTASSSASARRPGPRAGGTHRACGARPSSHSARSGASDRTTRRRLRSETHPRRNHHHRPCEQGSSASTVSHPYLTAMAAVSGHRVLEPRIGPPPLRLDGRKHAVPVHRVLVSPVGPVRSRATSSHRSSRNLRCARECVAGAGRGGAAVNG